jgi:hypothetical protein
VRLRVVTEICSSRSGPGLLGDGVSVKKTERPSGESASPLFVNETPIVARTVCALPVVAESSASCVRTPVCDCDAATNSDGAAVEVTWVRPRGPDEQGNSERHRSDRG